MNYNKTYYNIVHKAKSRSNLPDGVFEKHHIIPKSIGGEDTEENLVKLTPREHYVCHLLLTKMYTGKERKKMIYAAWGMTNLCNKHQHRKRSKNRLYETLRTEYIKLQKSVRGKAHHLYGRKTGRTKDDFTDEWKEKISLAKKGKPTWNKGIARPQSVKDAISKANKGKTAWNKGISRRWVTKDNINKLVYPNELDSFLKEEWSQGRCS